MGQLGRFSRRDPPAGLDRLSSSGDACVRVMLCHDVAECRDLMRAVLEQDPELMIVGEMAEGISGAALVREARPDVVLLDLGSPEMGRLDRLRRLRDASSKTAIAVLYSGAEPWVCERLLSAGADVCIDREASFADICLRIKTARQSLPARATRLAP